MKTNNKKELLEFIPITTTPANVSEGGIIIKDNFCMPESN